MYVPGRYLVGKEPLSVNFSGAIVGNCGYNVNLWLRRSVGVTETTISCTISPYLGDNSPVNLTNNQMSLNE